MKHQLLTAVVAAATLGIALAAGNASRPALVGAGISAVTALASIFAMGRFARTRKPAQAALAVVVGAFLLRLLLVALGTAYVSRTGLSVWAFVIGFFAPFFVYAAVEAAYVHTLRGTGPTA